MFIIFNEDFEFKGKSISPVILGNAPFLADSYFGHRTRLYNMDLLRNPGNVSKIIEKSYECGVRSINLANFGSVCEAFDMACDNGVEMQAVSTLGKTDMNYVMPNYKQAKEEAAIDEDIEKLSKYDNAMMLIDEFLVDDYDWDYLMGILDKINDTGFPAGLITSFPFKTSEKLLESPLAEDKNLFDYYMIPVNKVAYMMDCPQFLDAEKEKLALMLKDLDKKVIVSKIMAVGIQRPQDAFEFLKTLDYADMVAVGIASEHEAGRGDLWHIK